MNRVKMAHWALLVAWVSLAVLGTWRLMVWHARAETHHLALRQARQALQLTHELRLKSLQLSEWLAQSATDEPASRRIRDDQLHAMRQLWERLNRHPGLAGQGQVSGVGQLWAASAELTPAVWQEFEHQLNDRQGRLLDQLDAISQAEQSRYLAARREASLIFCLVIILGLGLLQGLRRWLLTPLAALISSASQVSAGELDTRAPSLAGPIRPLAEAFNRMLEVLVDSLRQEQALRRALEDANRHKTQFLATVGHELKTPLNAIMGLAEVLDSGLHGPVNERQRDYFTRIRQAGEHLLDLIAHLLDAARLELGQLRLQPSNFTLPELLKECHDWLTPQWQSQGRECQLEPPTEPLPALHQDRQRVRQILLNLLHNAAKFSPPASPIRITCGVADGRLWVAIHDQGPGISEADQARLFQPFVQLAGELSRPQGGAGLGLALSHELAHRMGGELRLAISGPEGSVFRLELPPICPMP